MSSWKHLVRQTLLRVGLDVRRAATAPSEEAVLRRLLAARKTTLVIDVGANQGQFVGSLWSAGYNGRVASFEPQSREHALLTAAAANVRSWEILPRIALGASNGTVTLNISKNSVSSSLLPMLPSHTNAAPGSEYTSSETVPLTTLDQVGPALLHSGDRVHLKIDTQGYELEVLKGAATFLSSVDSLQFEGALTPLYAGETLIEELIAYTRGRGFDLYSIVPGFVDPVSGKLFQCDCFFVRSSVE